MQSLSIHTDSIQTSIHPNLLDTELQPSGVVVARGGNRDIVLEVVTVILLHWSGCLLEGMVNPMTRPPEVEWYPDSRLVPSDKELITTLTLLLGGPQRSAILDTYRRCPKT